jgi:hypothetical protein
MKCLKLFLLIFFLGQSWQSDCQESDAYGLKRYFANVIPGIVLPTSQDGSLEQSIKAGLQVEIGNHFAFSKDKRFTGFVRLTWLRIGYNHLNIFNVYAAPAHVGLGIHYQYNNSASLNASLNGGIVLYTDGYVFDGFNGKSEYILYPQIKYNKDDFSVGIEYIFRPFGLGIFDLRDGIHYFGIVLGVSLGRNIN